MSDFAPLLEAAWAARADLHDSAGTDCYRVFDGRFEGAPGWLVDRYGDALLVQCFHREEADEAVLAAVVGWSAGRFAVVLKERGLRDSARAEGRLIAGELTPAPADDPFRERAGRLAVREDGLRYGVDLLYGQNTGLFLDARPMRAWVRAHADGRGLLNLFSYTSAFGVAAMAGGANYVTNVDLVPSAQERGAANYALNGFDPSRAHVRSDVFAFLKRQAGGTRRFGGVICDPPPVPTKKRGKRGKRDRGFSPRTDMAPLLRDAAALREPGGWLLALSAARHAELFEDQLPEGNWTSLQRGSDHPGDPGEGLRARILGAD